MERIRIKDIAQMANVSVGTVDRVIHGRSGVSQESRQRVEAVLAQLEYHPNMYASALASNKKYVFACLLPQHLEGEYWTAVEKGVCEALTTYSDFNISIETTYYDPYDYHSFDTASDAILKTQPDGVLFAPTTPKFTKKFAAQLHANDTPYIYIDSNIADAPALAFFGQHSGQSGYFAARMLMLLAGENKDEVVVFRRIKEGIIGSNQQENREVGFRKYMAEHHPSCRILELNLSVKYPDADYRLLDDFFAQHPAVASGITFNSKAYSVGEYLLDRKETGFKLIGYDLLEQNVHCLRKGSISFLIAQQPELQGYNGIKALCEHLILKKEITPMNYMPIDLLTVENIDFYLKIH